MNSQPPTIFSEFEDGCLCGNHEGFVNLRDKIDQLLSQEDDTICLYEDEGYEDCFVSLALRENEQLDTTPNTLGEKILLSSLLLIPVSILYLILVGAIQTLRQIISFF